MIKKSRIRWNYNNKNIQLLENIELMLLTLAEFRKILSINVEY